MKKIILFTIISLFTSTGINAQVADGKIKITDLNTVESNDSVKVSFTAQIGKNTAGKNQTYVFAPVLTDGSYNVSLPAIMVEGKGSKAMSDRRQWLSASTPGKKDVIYASNGDEVQYSATVGAQSWMHGGKLTLEGLSGNCCSYKKDEPALISESLHLYDEPDSIEVITETKRFLPMSLGDSLSVMFPFVVPEAMFDPEDPFKIYDDERANAIIIYFTSARNDIIPDYRGNAQTLTNLKASIDMLLSDPDSKVERVIVAGFSSPDGNFEVNDKLAFNRAVAVKKYLIQTTNLKDRHIALHNGSVDWKGLRLLVEKSNMEYKDEVLDIINNTPVWDAKRKTGRLTELKKLRGGKPYKIMNDEFFPLLRNGSFIKVFYSNEKH